ncbi:MAG: hypothetical protein AAFP20_02965 [Cyanobacteria bacterium J06614_10]
MKAFLVGLTLVAAAVGGGLGYATMQTNGTSGWYGTEDSVAGSVAGSRADTPQASTDAPTASLPTADATATDDSTQSAATGDNGSLNSTYTPSSSDVVISAGELNQMVTEAIATQPYLAPALGNAKEVKTTIADGRIESGMVMNLSEIPLESLPAEGQQAIEQINQTFPFLANREVYLGIEGSPQIEDGAFSLSDTYVRFGQLKLPVASVASQLGISQTDIEQQITGVLSQQGLTPEDIQVTDGQLVITGMPQ